MDKKTTLKTFFKKVWTNEDASAIKHIFVPEKQGKAHGLAKDKGISPEEFIAFQGALLELIKDVKITIDSVIESGDYIAADCTVTAVDRRTGTKNVSIMGAVTAKITDGKIRTAKNYFDFLHLFEGLDLLPENTFAKCLGGQRID